MGDFDREDAGEKIFVAVTRTGRAAVLSIVLFTALYIIDTPTTMAIAIAMIPLILTLLNLTPRLVNALTLLVAMSAVAWALAPEHIQSAVRDVLPS